MMQKSIPDTISAHAREPETLLKWRRRLFEGVQPPMKDLSYGLSIVMDETQYVIEQPTPFDEKKYRLWHEGEVVILPWVEAMRDVYLSDVASEIFHQTEDSLNLSSNAARHAALFAGGWFIHKTSADHAHVRIHSSCTENMNDLILVIAEKNTSISVVDGTQASDGRSARTVILFAKEGAKIEYIHDIDADATHHATVIPIIGRDAHVSYKTIGVSRTDSLLVRVDALLEQEGASVSIKNALMSSGKGCLDIYNYAHHRASYTESHLNAAGAVADSSRLVYRSDVLMQKEETKGMKGFQKARFLSVSKEAEVDAIPSLDIGQQDVACSHSVSVSFLKESDTFYLRLRGIGVRDAKALILEGFLVEQISDVTHDYDVLSSKIQDQLQYISH